MTFPTKHHDPTGADQMDHPAPSTRAVLLRAAADYELTATQSVALVEHLGAHPDDARVIEFERRLREEVATLSGGKASEALRDRVGAIASSHGNDATSPAGRIEPDRRAHAHGWLAIAASLVIVAGGGYTVVHTLQSGGQHFAPVAIDETYRLALVSFIVDHHKQCELYTEMAMRELKITSLDKAPAAFAGVIGRTLDLAALSIPGFDFKGAGRCAVPGGGRSVHLVFEAQQAIDTARPLVISLFIQQDTGEMTIDSGQTFRLMPKSGGVQPAYSGDIYVWRKNGFVYFLVSTSQTGLSSTLEVLGVDPPAQAI